MNDPDAIVKERMKSFTTAELLEDRAASVADLQVCDLADIHGVKAYFNGTATVAERRAVNERIVRLIDGELARRGVEVPK